MTIREIINRVENFKQPTWDFRTQMQWVNQIDETIMEDIIKKHKIRPDLLDTEFHCVEVDETFYVRDDDGQPTSEIDHVTFKYKKNHIDIDEEVFCIDRYCDLYLYWLLAKIDELNGDLIRYQNDYAMFQSYYLEYGNYVNRTYDTYPVKLRY